MKFEITQESMLLLTVMLFLMFLVNATSHCAQKFDEQKSFVERDR